jgi:hypothetical protein
LLSLCALGISSCGTIKPVPQFEAGMIVEETPLEKSSVYWVPYYNSKEPYEESFRKFLDKDPVCISADDYGSLKKYVEYLTAQAKKRCK